MKDIFLIGEISKLFGLSIRLLRYYDEIDLLKPAYTDPKTGYRYYSTHQFEQLNTILYLRELKVPLLQIKLFFNQRTPGNMMQILQTQQQEIAIQRKHLQLIEEKIQRRMELLANATDTVYNQLSEKIFSDRLVVSLKKEIPITNDLEYPIRELEQLHQLNAVVFLGKVGVSIPRQQLLQDAPTSFSKIFVLLEKEDHCASEPEIIPGGRYLTLRYQGTHKDSAPYYNQMLHYINQQGYTITGDSIEITLLDYGLATDPSEFTTELQIPYKNT